MEKVLKFISCKYYDFVNKETGEKLTGYACKCYDEDTKDIVKVKTDKAINLNFGDDILVKIVLKGKYASYQAAV